MYRSQVKVGSIFFFNIAVWGITHGTPSCGVRLSTALAVNFSFRSLKIQTEDLIIFHHLAPLAAFPIHADFCYQPPSRSTGTETQSPDQRQSDSGFWAKWGSIHAGPSISKIKTHAVKITACPQHSGCLSVWVTYWSSCLFTNLKHTEVLQLSLDKHIFCILSSQCCLSVHYQGPDWNVSAITKLILKKLFIMIHPLNLFWLWI